jgi:ABC-type Fe3+ transport system permease subunit
MSRLSVAVVLVIVITFIGFTAISQSANSVENTTDTEMQNETFNATEGIYDSTGNAVSLTVVWGGVAAFLLAACGVAVWIAHTTFGGGRR